MQQKAYLYSRLSVDDRPADLDNQDLDSSRAFCSLCHHLQAVAVALIHLQTYVFMPEWMVT